MMTNDEHLHAALKGHERAHNGASRPADPFAIGSGFRISDRPRILVAEEISNTLNAQDGG